MTKFILKTDLRVATAGGDSTFISPEGSTHSNELGKGWQNFPAGTEITLCASFPKTHTWMCTVLQPQSEEDLASDTPALIQGAIFRKVSFDKIVAASE